ncbi:hypothetical protein FQR65_LT20287 [Abscondita terminalis]|nr:hypothetical protein FQR65_LT20287 [Abscondita terminalis]
MVACHQQGDSHNRLPRQAKRRAVRRIQGGPDLHAQAHGGGCTYQRSRSRGSMAYLGFCAVRTATGARPISPSPSTPPAATTASNTESTSAFATLKQALANGWQLKLFGQTTCAPASARMRMYLAVYKSLFTGTRGDGLALNADGPRLTGCATVHGHQPARAPSAWRGAPRTEAVLGLDYTDFQSLTERQLRHLRPAQQAHQTSSMGQPWQPGLWRALVVLMKHAGGPHRGRQAADYDSNLRQPTPRAGTTTAPRPPSGAFSRPMRAWSTPLNPQHTLSTPASHHTTAPQTRATANAPLPGPAGRQHLRSRAFKSDWLDDG